MTEYNQPTLFDLEGVEKGETFGKRHYWYYVTNAKNTMMIVGLDDMGKPMWGEHDTRPTYGLWPYLFNTMGEARRYRDKFANSGNVKRWEFSYK